MVTSNPHPSSRVASVCTFGAVLIMALGGFAQGPLPAGSAPDNNAPPFLGFVQDEIILVLEPQAAQRARDNASQNALDNIPELAPLLSRFEVRNSRPQFARASLNSAWATNRVLARYFKVQFAGNLDAVTRAFSNHPLVEKVEPIGIHGVYATPNDTFYDDPPASFPHDQWHYWDANGIDADQAWDDETGDPNVVVAVLDTGVRYWHVELGGPNGTWNQDNPQTNGNIWVNPNEIPANGIDDDLNGFVDDTIGYDFVSDTNEPFTNCIDADCGVADNDPADGNGHGTHIAGTLAAITNNALGVAGIAGGFSNGTSSGAGNGSKVLALRIGWHATYLGQKTGLVRMDYAAEAMNYVADLVDQGVNVAAVNCSWGSSNTGGIDAAVDNLLAHDVMVMHAAGNSNANSPGYLGNKAGVMNVGATDKSGSGASFSNFGNWVDLAAPGVEIMSTYHDPDEPTSDYVAYMAGTSMATPHAVGVAALLESFNPGLSGTDKFNIMVNTAMPYNGSKDVGSGIVNARAALDAAGPPCDVSADFTTDIVGDCSPVTVSFIDLSTGPVTSWSWEFGDGNGSTEPNPVHEYTTPGTYTVSLTVTSASCGDTETKANLISVGMPPTADFTANRTSGSAPLSVTFTDLSTENPTSWLWDFGDGNGSTLQHPSHTYETPGTYTVTLTATNSCGSDDEVKTDYIAVSEAPDGSIAFAAADLPQQGTVSGDFTDTHASDDVYEAITEVESNGNPARRRSLLEHRWQFDVNPAEAVTLFVEAYRPDNVEGDDFEFEYSTDGNTYTPVLTVNSATEMTYSAVLPANTGGTVYVRVLDTDRGQGNRALDSIFVDQIYIESSGSVNSAPGISITAPADGSSFASGSNVNFTGTASDTEDGDLTAAIEWTSDIDGALGTGGSILAGLSDGIHTITALVMDSGGRQSTDSITVTVGSVPTLVVNVFTDKASYVHGELALIFVEVTDGVLGLAGVPVHVEMTTPKGRFYSVDGTTDVLGFVYITHTIHSKKDGVGSYNLEATASFPGYTGGTGTGSFQVTE